MSPDDRVALVTDELDAMLGLKAIGQHQHQQAVRYVEANRDEVGDMLVYSSVRDVVDSVLEVSRLQS